MTDQEDNINLHKIVSYDKNQEIKSWPRLRKFCPRSLIVFLSQHFVNLLNSLVILEIQILQNLCRINSLDGGSV